jgi:concentrative nucleoside transporter, CNT family
VVRQRRPDLPAGAGLGAGAAGLAPGRAVERGPEAGSFIGQKTVLNEFIAYAEFGPLAEAGDLSSVTIVIVTFALAGFANFSSIAIQIGTISSLCPELRPTLARLGLLALLAGSLANLANAAIAGVVVSI